MNRQAILESVVRDQLKTDIPRMDVGDTIGVHFRIVEGEKERIQIFQGTLIGRTGGGINESIIVRRLVGGSGVERTIPIHSPRVAKYEVVRRADARRAKLYFLRDRIGKATRLRDRRRGMKHVAGAAKTR